DCAFKIFDRDRRIVDAEDAGTFTGRGADSTGEIGEVVGFMKPVESLFPQPPIDQIVPFRNEVVNRATGSHSADERAAVAEGNAALHAAGRLLTEFLFLHVEMELIPIANAFDRWTVQRQFAQVLDKSGRFAHVKSNLSQRRRETQRNAEMK